MPKTKKRGAKELSMFAGLGERIDSDSSDSGDGEEEPGESIFDPLAAALVHLGPFVLQRLFCRDFVLGEFLAISSLLKCQGLWESLQATIHSFLIIAFAHCIESAQFELSGFASRYPMLPIGPVDLSERKVPGLRWWMPPLCILHLVSQSAHSRMLLCFGIFCEPVWA